MIYEDEYMNPAIRRKRAEGVDELYGLVEDIVWADNQVKDLGWLAKTYYKKQLYKLHDSVGDDYMSLRIDCHHQIANDAYEQTLVFGKGSLVDRIKRLML